MKAHILIVDDDSRVTSALRRTLAYEGYQISSAMDGEGALAIARTKPPDLVILDLMLPGIDGLEVCRRLRAAGDGIAVSSLTGRWRWDSSAHAHRSRWCGRPRGGPGNGGR